MKGLATMAGGLYGALLMASGRAEGLRLVPADIAGAARSFIAAAICLPAFICLRLIDWTEAGVPPVPGHVLAVDLIFYVIGWAGFALLSRSAVAAMGGAARWPLFIAAWNWCNAVQYLLLVAASIPGLLGAPPWIDQFAQLIALGWALWLEWFAARLALGCAALPAAGLVGLDVVLGLMLAILTGALTGS